MWIYFLIAAAKECPGDKTIQSDRCKIWFLLSPGKLSAEKVFSEMDTLSPADRISDSAKIFVNDFDWASAFLNDRSITASTSN